MRLCRYDYDLVLMHNFIAALSSVVNVQITVTDINDNAPQFGQDIYTTMVPEFLARTETALQVRVRV